ncbi:Geranylgeranyl transferase type-2 subunit alpha [Rhynchospora pubera]|uniref:Geranylgeranyl transferase type-2 subunit alpha n=1 Tax=Rhynchospora pubera TaxID=906938 RepID=A0AAV8GTM0_9POAL|nr:Geranylgeranyl transferase type-2 subunit alpha [Rhynchospora pubera]
MHGRPRKATKQEDPAAAAAKSARLRELQSQLLHFHHNRIYTKEAVSVSSKLLEINPEIYTGWNYRKLAFQHNLKEVSDTDTDTDTETIKSAIEDELRMVEVALRRNPKSYGAWYHRKWILGQKLVLANFDHEFRLLDMLLKADARNFHGWNYRRFIARLKDVSEEEELKFTMDMINTNFSNYSAWHNRSMLLSKLLRKKAKGFHEEESILSDEFELVRQALFTDPSDQSGWFYHLWLLDQTSTPHKPHLVSSWPSDKLNIEISAQFKEKCERFPIIFCFNQQVDGVNLATVTINSKLVSSEHITWKPLSANNSRKSKIWVGFLENFNKYCDNSEGLSVEISVHCCESIVHSEFVMKLSHMDHQGKNGDGFEELFLWDCPKSQEINPYLVSYDPWRLRVERVEEDAKWHLDTLSAEIALFKEMSECDEDSKFVKLTLTRLLGAHNSIKSGGSAYFEEILKLYDDLIKLDAPHYRYYRDERSLVLLDQMTSSKDSLVEYCSRCENSSFSCINPQLCINFSGLNLTRIGFVERLLWVQILDLSHNNLTSLLGLEALQLLVCLNLSHNQIMSFTALEPIKSLQSLKVLDLSFNEIGSHPVDTTRYLCSSPLSHSCNVTETMEELARENIKIGDFWEAILLFESLQLAQLDMQGNPVTNERFRVLVEKVIPCLKWLDGKPVR